MSEPKAERGAGVLPRTPAMSEPKAERGAGVLPRTPAMSEPKAMRRWVFIAALAAATFVHDARATAPSGHYALNGGTARDTKTGLTWQRGTAPTRIFLADATSYCAGLSLGGMSSGWRVPNIRELLSTVDPSAGSAPLWDQATFGVSGPGDVWSSTPVANDPDGKQWGVSFAFGSTETALPTVALGARCVHD